MTALKQIANDLHTAFLSTPDGDARYAAWLAYLKAKNTYLAARHARFGE